MGVTINSNRSVFRPNSTGLWSDVNPSTLHQNLLHQNYLGGNNPKNYYGNDTYSVEPSSRIDRPAMFHDIDYDKLNITGLKGMLTSTAAIPADLTLIGSEYALTLDDTVPLGEKFEAFGIAVGVTILTAPKTIMYGVSQYFK